MEFSSAIMAVFGLFLHAWMDPDCGKVSADRGYAITDTAIYYCINDGKPIYSKYKLEGVDMASFEVIPNQFNEYAKDKNGVFYYETRLDGADPNSFKAIGPGYGKDKMSVFYYKKKILGADPESFQMLNFEYNKDKNAVYNFENKMPE